MRSFVFEARRWSLLVVLVMTSALLTVTGSASAQAGDTDHNVYVGFTSECDEDSPEENGAVAVIVNGGYGSQHPLRYDYTISRDGQVSTGSGTVQGVEMDRVSTGLYFDASISVTATYVDGVVQSFGPFQFEQEVCPMVGGVGVLSIRKPYARDGKTKMTVLTSAPLTKFGYKVVSPRSKKTGLIWVTRNYVKPGDYTFTLKRRIYKVGTFMTFKMYSMNSDGVIHNYGKTMFRKIKVGVHP